MSTNTVRQRSANKEKAVPSSPVQSRDGKTNGSIDNVVDQLPSAVKPEWDYKLALIVITSLAFVTRFWGLGHPNEVVFDEVHFGKVCSHVHNRYNSILSRLHPRVLRANKDLLN